MYYLRQTMHQLFYKDLTFSGKEKQIQQVKEMAAHFEKQNYINM